MSELVITKQELFDLCDFVSEYFEWKVSYYKDTIRFTKILIYIFLLGTIVSFGFFLFGSVDYRVVIAFTGLTGLFWWIKRMHEQDLEKFLEVNKDTYEVAHRVIEYLKKEWKERIGTETIKVVNKKGKLQDDLPEVYNSPFYGVYI